MRNGRSALAVILMAAIVSGCAEQKVDVEAAQEQKNQQILNTYSHLTKIFDDCVERSARRQYASSGDLNAAIEKGFSACNAEESAVIERLDVGVTAGFGRQQIGPYKFKLKQRLLQIIASNEPSEPEKRRGNTAPGEPARQ
jgi:hypothetical protein